MDLGDMLTAYLKSLEPWYEGEGDGEIVGLVGTASTIEETIRCEATDATHFSVSGSVSGLLGTATVGAVFTSPAAHFTITAGPKPWVAGDSIGFEMTPPGSLRAFGDSFRYMQSNEGGDPAVISAALFRKGFAASLKVIRNRCRRSQWN